MRYEILVESAKADGQTWENLVRELGRLHAELERFTIGIQFDEAVVRFFLETGREIPCDVALPVFYVKRAEEGVEVPCYPKSVARWFWRETGNFLELKNYLKVQRGEELEYLELIFVKAWGNLRARMKIYTESGQYFAPVADYGKLLAANTAEARGICFAELPKNLDAHKILPRLNANEEAALLEIETFPYAGEKKMLRLAEIDLDRHGLILGASGSGKSKLVSRLVEMSVSRKLGYKFLIIDPHAALEREIGAFSQVVDFEETAIDLLEESPAGVLAAVESLLDVYRGLLEQFWNPRLERVLRHTLYLLIVSGELKFANIRKVLLDLPYRNGLIQKCHGAAQSTKQFFQTEFSEIKSRNYEVALAPIIALGDEIEMLPALGTGQSGRARLSDLIRDNTVTLVSLDRSRLGNRSVKIITGFLTEQIFCLAQQEDWNEELICVVDEVAVVANPILGKLLAEGRKFGIHLMLIGQYFGAIPEQLKTAILANTSNYFLFRLARDDATVFANALEMKIPLEDTMEQKIKTFTELENRQCVARVSAEDKLYPAVRAQTLEYAAQGRGGEKVTAALGRVDAQVVYDFGFGVDSRYSLRQILRPKGVVAPRSGMSLERRLLMSLQVYLNHSLR